MNDVNESIDLNSTVDSNMDVLDESSADGKEVDNKHGSSNIIPDNIKGMLANGMLNLLEPDLAVVHERVKELLRNQGVLLDSTQNELTQLKECAMLNEVTNTFINVKNYHKKLVTIKKDMNQLLEQSSKVKVRAQKLQLQKEKDELALASEREKQLKYEKELAAKPAAEYLSSN